jgi:DNA-directed RNA polymerase subunit alpha
MEELLLPSKIELLPGKDARQATFVMEPCFHGYGTTIGNALRRVLLSSLPGAAVVAAKIKGATHEFATLPGVQEDVLEIILNLKQLRMRLFTDEVVRLKLHFKGEGKVTGADVEKNSDVEIVNPDSHIATLTDKGSEVDMEIFVSRGRGFLPTEERGKEKAELGVIAIDAVFTPVREVGFRVENTRVGQITNYDKLVMDIETDGTITPAEALDAATKILTDHFLLIANRGLSAALQVEVAEVAAEVPVSEEAAPAEAPVEEVSGAVSEDKPKKKAKKADSEDKPKKAPKKKAK